MKYRITSSRNERFYTHIPYFLLLIIVFVGFYFHPIFLDYTPPKSSADLDTENFDKILETKYISKSWQNNIAGGFPLFQLRGIDKLLADIKNFLFPRENLVLFFLLLGGLGIYTIFIFYKCKPFLAVTAAFLFSLSFFLYSLFLSGQDEIIRTVGFLPWIIFLTIYLKSRISLLAGGSLSFSLILAFKSLVPGLIISIIILNLVLWLYYILISLKEKNTLNSLIFTFLFITANILAIAAVLYPMFYLFDLQKHVASCLLGISYWEILLIYLHIALIFLWGIIIKRSTDLIDDDETKYFDMLRIIFFIFVFLFTTAAVMRFYFDLLFIPVSLIFVCFLMILHLVLINFFRRKKFSQRVFAIAFVVSSVIILFISQLGNLQKLNPKSMQYDYKDRTISDDFFAQDHEIFRIYPLGREFSWNSWGVHNQTIGGRALCRLKRYSEVMESCLNTELQFRIPINWNILDLLNVKYLASRTKISTDKLKYSHYDLEKKLIIYENLTYLPRAWFVNEIISIDNKNDIFKLLNSSDFDPSLTAIVESDIGLVEAPRNESITLDSVNAEFLQITTRNDSTSLLVISEIYYPGSGSWKAYIDDSPAPIHPIDYILRGVVVPAGEHKITMIYELDKLSILLLINIISLGITVMIILLGLYHYIRKNYKGEIVYVIKK